jgi:putative ubiquitin-RnfH superfamily antitoxin RatB of RatAB toxin-antitoxin module
VSATAPKRCQVVYATRASQLTWTVELAETATVADALLTAREMATRDLGAAAALDIPWESASVGIFGQVCARSTVPADGDRIEIYRPLAADPRERRRERVRTQRRASGTPKR